MIVAAGAIGRKPHSSYHRLFAAARWSRDRFGLAGLDLIEPFVQETIFLALDDTLARKRGDRLPTPHQMLDARAERLCLEIYGRQEHARVSDLEARVYAVPERPLRGVAVEALKGAGAREAFYSTAHTATATQVLTWYA
jgi:hypothetical protein